MAFLLWLEEHADDVEADFLVFFRIKDPWSLPVDVFLAKALRLFFYQGVLQYRASEEEEGSDQVSPRYDHQDAPRVTGSGVDMRHNMAAAWHAAKSVKGGTDDDEVKVLPAATWMAMAPPGTVEHQVVDG